MTRLPEAILARVGEVSGCFRCWRGVIRTCFWQIRHERELEREDKKVACFVNQYLCNLEQEELDPEDLEEGEDMDFPDVFNDCFMFTHDSQFYKPEEGSAVTIQIIKFIDEEADELRYRLQVTEVLRAENELNGFLLRMHVASCTAKGETWETVQSTRSKIPPHVFDRNC